MKTLEFDGLHQTVIHLPVLAQSNAPGNENFPSPREENRSNEKVLTDLGT